MKTRILAVVAVALPLCAQQVSVTQVKGLPFASSAQYNFTRTNGKGASGDLSASGAGKTVTLTPCPLGPNAATTANWYLRLADGTGTAETVKVTGGTCTSGAASGTVVFDTSNTHTGAWTLRPTMAGVLEANAALCSTGGTIYVPAGTHDVYSRVEICGGVKLIGAGRERTIFKIADGTWLNGATPWKNAGNVNIHVVISTVFDAENFEFQGFTVDGNRSNQSGALPYSFPVVAMGSRHGKIEDVVVRNLHGFGAGFGLIGPQSWNILVTRSAVIGNSDAAGGACIGGFFSQGPDNTFTNNYTSFLCDDAFISSGYRSKRNKFFGNTAIAHAGNVAFHCESGYECEFTNNSASGQFNACFGGTDIGEGIGNMIFQGNTCKAHVIDTAQTGTAQGVPINGFSGGAHSPNDLTLSGSTLTFVNNIIEGCSGRGVSTGGLAKRMNISFNTIKGCTIGIDFNSATDSPEVVVIKGNILDHNSSTGLNIQDVAGPPISTFVIDSNIATDTGSPKVQGYGFTFSYDGSDIDNAIITNNLLTGNLTGGIAGFNLYAFNGVYSGNVTGDADTGVIRAPGAVIQFGAGSGGLTFTQLGAAGADTNGQFIYCKDCTVASPCAGGGTGAFAKGLNNTWVCN